MKDSLQTALIDEIIENKVPVTIFLTNGVQLRGNILNHDDTVIVLEEEHRCKIIYKHTLSTIVPFRPLDALNGHFFIPLLSLFYTESKSISVIYARK